VRSEEHRRMLARDARYYCFRGVEQLLVRCRISPILDFSSAVGGSHADSGGVEEEIEIGLEDVRDSGISVGGDAIAGGDGVGEEGGGGEVSYARPYVDDFGRRLVLEVGGGGVVRVILDCGGRFGQVEFWGETAGKMRSLVGVVGVRTGLPLSDSRGGPLCLRCTIDDQADVFVDGQRWGLDDDRGGRDAMVLGQADGGWMAKKSQWKIKATACEDGRLGVSLEAVKIEAYRSERAKNHERGFL